MKLTAKLMTALTLTCSATMAMALSTSKSQDLGLLTSAGLSFGNSFNVAQTFTDYFQFTLGTGSGATGGETDTFAGILSRDVTVSSIQLREFGTSNYKLDTNAAISEFTFVGLTAGVKYELVVKGSAGTNLLGAIGTYDGTIKPVTSSTSVASAAPEPAELLLMAMGLGGAAFWVRRQKRA
jgi:hypothetical protein